MVYVEYGHNDVVDVRECYACGDTGQVNNHKCSECDTVPQEYVIKCKVCNCTSVMLYETNMCAVCQLEAQKGNLCHCDDIDDEFIQMHGSCRACYFL